MVEASIVPQTEIAGQTIIGDQVIGAIANTAAQEVDGVASLGSSSVRRIISERLGGAERRSRGVSVVAGRREAIVDLDLIVYYGYSIPDIVSQVRENVSSRISEMCGLVTKEINININAIEFDDGNTGRFSRVE